LSTRQRIDRGSVAHYLPPPELPQHIHLKVSSGKVDFVHCPRTLVGDCRVRLEIDISGGKIPILRFKSLGLLYVLRLGAQVDDTSEVVFRDEFLAVSGGGIVETSRTVQEFIANDFRAAQRIDDVSHIAEVIDSSERRVGCGVHAGLRVVLDGVRGGFAAIISSTQLAHERVDAAVSKRYRKRFFFCRGLRKV
jgi:hypothetical protein